MAQVLCNSCGQHTNHQELVPEHEQHFDEHSYPEMEIEFARVKWTLLQCCGCESVTFRESWTSSEDRDPVSGEEQWYVTYWPPREAHSLKPASFKNVPEGLVRVYQDSISCLNSGALTLCAAGLRAVLEAVCSDLGVKKGQVVNEHGEKENSEHLAGRINGLAEKEHITPAHATALQGVRFLGNDAVHELAKPPIDELGIALELIEKLLADVYKVAAQGQKILRLRALRRPRGDTT